MSQPIQRYPSFFSSPPCSSNGELDKTTLIKVSLCVLSLLFLGGGIALCGWGKALLPQVFITAKSQIISGCIMGVFGLVLLMPLVCLKKQRELNAEESSLLQTQAEESASKADPAATNKVVGTSNEEDIYTQIVENDYGTTWVSSTREEDPSTKFNSFKKLTKRKWETRLAFDRCFSRQIEFNNSPHFTGAVHFNAKENELYYTKDSIEIESTDGSVVKARFRQRRGNDFETGKLKLAPGAVLHVFDEIYNTSRT